MSRPASNDVPDQQQGDGSGHGHAKAPSAESGCAVRSEGIEKPAADHGADDAEKYVEGRAFIAAIDGGGGKKAGDQTEGDPASDDHQHDLFPLQ
jgi:hypothetical protein